jgi:hypothetical protein
MKFDGITRMQVVPLPQRARAEYHDVGLRILPAQSTRSML